MSRNRNLEIDEDMNFQRKEWLAQRVGVALLALLVLGALLGLTGMGGPLSHGVAGAPGGPVRIEYERFVRRGGMATLKVHLSTLSEEARLWISDAYDFSLVGGFVVIATLVTSDIAFGWVESRWPAFGRIVGSLPVVVVERGKLLEDRADREGITLSDILAAGRERHGLERLEQFKYAILERHGGISVVPAEDAR